MTLINYRDQIDSIDLTIIKLLEERLKISKQIGLYKKEKNLPILNQNREEYILNNLYENSDLNNNDIKKIYTKIFEISKNNQN
tara:strand:- start:1281 stop:1529 length:249 start_codon:yes stop_codon:yes gene_type:complete